MRARQPFLLPDDLPPLPSQSSAEPVPPLPLRPDELRLVRLASDLGAGEIGGRLTRAEQHVFDQGRAAGPPTDLPLAQARAAILAGEDPLGEALCRARPARERRALGAFYTQPAIIAPMLEWVLARQPARLVDAGCGSGRFAAGAVRRQPDLAVVAIDVDPLATLLTRAALAVLEAPTATVLQADYATLQLPRIAGRTAYVGNPPYVRHHNLSVASKAWAVRTGRQLGYTVSGLAGLHAHFYLATAVHAQPGDIGCFVTSSEWLDVNYGAIIRDLLIDGLGGQALHVVDPRAVPFEDAMTTAVVACFEVGQPPDSIRFQRVQTATELRDLEAGRAIGREALARTTRWTPLLRELRVNPERSETLPLRALARVHRGVATGANDFFVLTRERARALGIEAWCRPAITSAEEILQAGGVVHDGPDRRVLFSVPADVDRAAHPLLDAYLRSGEQPVGDRPPVSRRYITSHRRPWWHLGRSAPPPIVVSYMARQAPVFALNPDGLALVNIAHGLYPVSRLAPEQLAAFVEHLNGARESFRGSGRTYHGGLEKFEPRELEALLIPADGPWR